MLFMWFQLLALASSIGSLGLVAHAFPVQDARPSVLLKRHQPGLAKAPLNGVKSAAPAVPVSQTAVNVAPASAKSQPKYKTPEEMRSLISEQESYWRTSQKLSGKYAQKANDYLMSKNSEVERLFPPTAKLAITGILQEELVNAAKQIALLGRKYKSVELPRVSAALQNPIIYIHQGQQYTRQSFLLKIQLEDFFVRNGANPGKYNKDMINYLMNINKKIEETFPEGDLAIKGILQHELLLAIPKMTIAGSKYAKVELPNVVAALKDPDVYRSL